MAKPKKGLTINGCVRRARKYIAEFGMCLLWFDVQGSRNFPNGFRLHERLTTMMQDLNRKFGKHFPRNNLSVIVRFEKGFQLLHGDSSWTGINNAEIIPEICKYQKEKYPDILLWWGVAKDGYKDRDWL